MLRYAQTGENQNEHRTAAQESHKSAWTEERLQSLFARYNRKYWRGKLPVHRLVIATIPKARGQCDSRRKVITSDVERNRNDRDVRSTVLHEMARPLLVFAAVVGMI